MATKRQKLLAQRDRLRRELERQAEERDLQSNYNRLKALSGGFARKTEKVPAKQKIYRTLKAKLNAEEQRKKYGPRFEVPGYLPAKADPGPSNKKLNPYDPHSDMHEREVLAKEKTKELGNRIGPLYNKGGDQFMGDLDYEDFKKGLLKRRS